MCAEIVKDCGGGAVTLSQRALGAAERLREWLSTSWSDLASPRSQAQCHLPGSPSRSDGQLQAVEPNSLRLIFATARSRRAPGPIAVPDALTRRSGEP